MGKRLKLMTLLLTKIEPGHVDKPVVEHPVEKYKDEIERIAEEQGYEVQGRSGCGYWLLYNDPPDEYSDVFPKVELFEYIDHSDVSPDSHPLPYPTTTFRYDDLLLPETEYAAQKSLHNRIVAWLKKRSSNGVVRQEDVAVLYTNREALIRQIERNGDRLSRQLVPIIRVLLAWLVETERVRLEGKTIDDLDEEEIESHGDFYFSAWAEWTALTGGVTMEAVEQSDEILFEYGTPIAVAETAKAGLLYYYPRVHRVITEIAHLDFKRLVYEDIIYSILMDEPLYEWDKAQKRWLEAGIPKPPRAWKNLFTERKIMVVIILLKRDGSREKYIRRDGWTSRKPNDLFVEIEQRTELTGDPPGNSAEKYLRRRLGDEFPGGDNMEGWFRLAEKWAVQHAKNIGQNHRTDT